MKHKFKILAVIIILVSIAGYFWYMHYEGDFYEVCFTYYQDNATYVVVGDVSIKVADEKLTLSAKHIINDPFNHRIQSPTQYNRPNAYMYDDVVTLYDDAGRVYIVDVLNRKSHRLENVSTYQINDKKTGLLALSDHILYMYSDRDIDSKEILMEGVKSFVASDDFKQIFVINEFNELIRINAEGEIKETLSYNMTSDMLLKIDDYLLYNDDFNGHVYAMDYQKLIGDFNQNLSLQLCQYIDNSLLIRTGDVLYRVIGKDIEKIRGNYLLTEDVSAYYQATNRTINQMRGEVQALLLDTDENLYVYQPKDGRTAIELGANEKYIGTFTEDLSYIFKEKGYDRITYYSEDNKWRGKRVYLNAEPLWVKGHNEKNFIYLSDEKELLQFYNGETVRPLNILSDHFRSIIYGKDDDYYIVDRLGLTHVDKKGEEQRIFEGEGVYNTIYDPVSEQLFFLSQASTLYAADGTAITKIAEAVDRVDTFRNSLYFLTKTGALNYYHKGDAIIIAEDVSGVHAVSDNIRLLGSYNAVHMFYILEEK